MIEVFIFLLTGVLTGIAAGLFGLGGGLIIVPVITYSLISFSNIPLDQAILYGISTSLSSMEIKITPSGLSRFLAKYRRGIIIFSQLL